MSKIKVPRPSIIATLAPESANSEERTVDATFYSGATVPRFSWLRGEYMLTLSTEKGAVRLKSLNSGTAPVLETHSDWSTRDVLGVVEKGWLEDGSGKATLRFLQNDEDADRVWNKVQQKVVRNVSMGVRIHRMKETSGTEDKVKSYLATDWEPFEISVVPIGADPGAHIQLALDTGEQEIEVEEFAARATSPEEAHTMPETHVAGNEARVDTDAVTLAAQAAERTRVLEIGKIAKAGRIDATFADQHIAAGTDVAEFRRLAFDQLAARSEQNPTREHHAEVSRDEGETRRLAFSQAILHRGNPIAYPLTEQDPGYNARGLASRGLLTMAAEVVRAHGKNPDRMSQMEIATFVMGTSDFPLILADSANKSLRAGYEKYNSQWRLISARRTAPNFKSQYELSVGMTASFPLVPEESEFKHGSITEGRESWRLYTYGQIIAFTRQVLINDDLGALTNIPEQLGMKAAIKQADLVWGVVTANAALSDSIALFDDVAGRGGTLGNLVSTGTAISDTNIGIARGMMRAQKDLAGDYLNIEPRYLVVPAAKERLALQYLSTNYVAAQPTNINIFAGTMTPIVEPRLDATSATAWYLFADPAVAPVIIYAYLDGNEGIYSETRQGFEVDGVEFKARMDFGCGAIDFRGAVRNDGA